MADHGETAILSPMTPHLDRRDVESLTDSDKDTDNFEDAHDAAPETASIRSSSALSSSARSLTQRSVAQPKPPPAEDDEEEEEKTETEEKAKEEPKKESMEEPEEEIKKPTPAEPEPEPESQPQHKQEAEPATEGEAKADVERIESTSLGDRDDATLAEQRSSVQSNGQLDNVSLDDEDLDEEPQEKEVEKVKDMSLSEPGPEPDPPKKSISLSSITNSLPAMPWSPGAQDASNKIPDAAAAAGAAPTTTVPTSPGAAPAGSAPAVAPPPSRKLAGAFSWLSRSSSKDLSNVSPPISARRNTASSTTTLTSNPEMLGKLDEEGRRNSRHSLKDRFKAMRMREEAGITSLPDDGDANGIANLVNKGPNRVLASPTEDEEDGAVQPPPSPRPAHATLAPGTASGAAAGPSTLSDEPVDWDLWQSVVYEGPAAVAKTSAEELRKATAAGIPSAIRGVIWQVLTQSQSEELEAVYRDLVARGTDKEKDRQSNGSLGAGSNGSTPAPGSSASSVHSEGPGSQPPSPPPKDTPKDEAAEKKKKKEDVAMIQRLEKTIRRDLGQRTAYSKFAAAQGLQEGLYGVCKAYALYDEDVGYAQGMNFLIMPLLFNMSEEEAFCLLVKLMNNYQLRDLFIQDMPGLHMHLYQFERLLEDTEPALYCHLRRRGISPHLYATQWFLTLFSYRFPLQLVLRIYDLILSEGLSAILKFGIVLMQKNSQTLLGMTDMAQLTTYLRDRLFDVYIESAPTANSILENGFFGSSTSSMDKEVYRADQLVHDACEVELTPVLLQAWRVEWEEKTREEKDRQVELETLRSQNTSYAAKIRKLEERLQAVDREQADLATELVHTKVENEELKDQNESLTGQVRELKIVIEKQPVEIEDQWKLERDALIERNQRVHEENEKVEREMAELEEQLVQTKMQYAEINSQHETLQRKWNDLRRTFA